MIYSTPRLYDYLSADGVEKSRTRRECLSSSQSEYLKKIIIDKTLSEVIKFLKSDVEFMDHTIPKEDATLGEKSHLIVDNITTYAMQLISDELAKAIMYDSLTESYEHPLENENLEKFISLLPFDFFVYEEKGERFVRDNYFTIIKNSLLISMKNCCKQETVARLQNLKSDLKGQKHQQEGLKIIADIKEEFTKNSTKLLSNARIMCKRMELLLLGWTKQNIEKFLDYVHAEEYKESPAQKFVL